MSGVLYVIEQLGQALAEANRRIADLEERLRQQDGTPPGS